LLDTGATVSQDIWGINVKLTSMNATALHVKTMGLALMESTHMNAIVLLGLPEGYATLRSMNVHPCLV
jgi:hypothetical protein